MGIILGSTPKMAVKRWIPEVLLLIALSQASTSGEKADSKIVDGWVADIREVPYHALVLSTGPSDKPGKLEVWSTCGSTIVSRQWLVTAGHCVKSRYFRSFNYSAIFLAMGVDNRKDYENMPRSNSTYPEGLPKVDMYVCHPNFKWVYFKENGLDHTIPFDDICLLRVDHELQSGRYIGRAGLPWKAYDRNYVDREFTISGFGDI